MRGTLMLYLDQHGRPFWARTVRELQAACGGGSVHTMYADKIKGPLAGQTVRTGYVIGRHWLTRYQPVELPA